MDSKEYEVRVYTVREIQQILSISKNAVYSLIANAPFKVIKIGQTYRINKDSFDKWLNSD